MSGSGGRGFPVNYPPNVINSWVEETADSVARLEHDGSINGTLADLLAQYNDRDVALTRERLDEIQKTLEDALDASLDLRFGGSVAKHTFVDGLSDVDALVILRDRELASMSAREILDQFAEILSNELSYTVSVHEGQLAVTVHYQDHMDIQLLPAVQADDGVRIPAPRGAGWSSIIHPDNFARTLTDTNQRCHNRLVPVIKLAKAALTDLAEDIRPTGYHTEALAVEAFRDYNGPYNYKRMLHHFFRKGSELALEPIRDRTRQSIRVDDHLGPANSTQRWELSGAMDRIARRMDNADRAGSRERWLDAIGE